MTEFEVIERDDNESAAWSQALHEAETLGYKYCRLTDKRAMNDSAGNGWFFIYTFVLEHREAGK